MGYPENKGTGCTASFFEYGAKTLWVGCSRRGILTRACGDKGSALKAAAEIDAILDNTEWWRRINLEREYTTIEDIKNLKDAQSEEENNIFLEKIMANIIEPNNGDLDHIIWDVGRDEEDLFLISNKEGVIDQVFLKLIDADTYVGGRSLFPFER